MRRYRTATNDFENGRPKRDRADWRFAVNSRHSEAEIDLMLHSSGFLTPLQVILEMAEVG
jgi:hypothetical protein